MHAEWLRSPVPTRQDFTSLQSLTTVSLLADDALLGCIGPDSAKFLQGQLTCNLQEITTTQARTGAHCTPKGRMVTNFLLAQTGESEYLFRIHNETLAALQKSLQKYIVFSKAKLREAGEEYLLLGIQGPAAESTIARLFGSAPQTIYAMQSHQNGFVIRVSQAARFECWISASTAQAIWTELCATLTVTGHTFWHWLNIRDGLGDIRAETIEEFIPQMLNLQLTDGISFTKGCYTGQEIVARMQYRGTLKKSAYRIAGKGVSPKPATPLFQENASQASGQIVIAEAVGDDQWEALAVIQHDALTHPLHTTNSACITLLTLPYIDQDPQ